MNKYRDKSDFEINKAVAEKVGIIQHLYLAEFLGEVIWDVTSNDNYNGFISKKGLAFDPCNNPADAMPIIIENKIDLTHLVGDMVCAKHKEYWCIRKNPYRAGCEVYLLMKDAENEKS